MIKSFVAGKVKEFLHENGLKQNYLAKKLNRTNVEMCNILNGKAGLGADDFYDICQVLKVTPNDILKVESSPKYSKEGF